MRFSLDKSFGIADVIARSFDIDFSDGATVSGVMAGGVMVSLSNHMIAAVVSLFFDPSTSAGQAELRATFIPEVS
jgi:acyl-coenzyme A thioesterase PaaI-like protein